MNGLEAVEILSLYLHEKQDVKVFKFEKAIKHKGEYIAINHLPFTFGQLANQNNVLNVNIHVPALTSGGANIPRMTRILSVITGLIPYESEQEEKAGLNLQGSYFSILSVSQPMEDKDGTFFVNIRIKLITNQANF